MSENKAHKEKIEPILSILVCPSCKSPLKAKKKGENFEFLYCEQCNADYPIEDGIPNLMTHEV